MSWLHKIFTDWKAGFNARQKETQFLQGLQNLPDVLHPIQLEGDEINFSHSGHAGDIIYSIPTMYALAAGRKINLYLSLYQPNRDFTKQMKHPNGNVMLTEKSVALFAPLLLAQPAFLRCEALTNQTIHYDLAAFREFPFDYRMGSITRWYFLTYGISCDLGKPWLQVIPNERYTNAIVIARSSRYHTPKIDYGFLKKYPTLFFVGMPDEFDDMKKQIPNLVYQPVTNFLELASVIAGSKLFIGNQSFPFSLAEALKVRRVLEVFPQCPNVLVEGANAYDFCYQPQFEKIVTDLLGQ
ncbi:MAG: hypothetical protein M0Q26_05575 [Chitinophagaceae bacterium]|nr:hypothetical protein [Chitinophagaceae bacterium]MDP1764041.1 hypothetical protein [Sediminibacterium sp.]MDP1811951.1 hypothetical protein [Sediminibacterium sp.]MDP3128417.1 hypothetical protein [Sediminibacterium sp.]MDP3667214.1 hypothetical protein [Sediminibacterium sp.]